MSSPIDQFIVKTIGNEINIAGLDISFTNSSLVMLLTVALIMVFFYVSLKKTSIVPTKLQMVSELSHDFVSTIARENIGEKAKLFFPFIYSLFLFILFANLIAIVPYSFAITSQIAVTFTLAISVLIIATTYGIYKHGFRFIRVFVPSGIPMVIMPLMLIIEFISYFAKALSMGIRLFANIMAGHIIMEIFAGFVIAMGLLGIIPFAFTTILFGFEVMIACLQAYIFTILTCLFIQQVIEFH